MNPAKLEARRLAKSLGHDLGPIKPIGRAGVQGASCRTCRRWVKIVLGEIIGTASTEQCKAEGKS